MGIMLPYNLACPLDGLPLRHAENQLVCPQRHSFDIARQGYINLLPVQQKRSRQPGDSKTMVAARRNFLETGLYSPISNKINALTSLCLQGKTNTCILDAGCGEGYYLQHLQQFLENTRSGNNVSFVGLDISKPAIVEASRRSRKITWLVGSNKNVPVQSDSVDMLICGFGFPAYESFKRVLTPDGNLLLVEAGPLHLLELRRLIYPAIKTSDRSNTRNGEEFGFKQRAEYFLKFSMKLATRQQINDLMAMTPHLYRATKDGKKAVEKLDSIELTVDVVFRILETG